MIKIGRNIKKLRELRNYTQEYMAEQMKMSQSGYSKIEQDETDTPISRLNQIAEILQVSLPDLLTFDENKLFLQFHNQHNQNLTNVQIGTIEREVYENHIKDLQNEIAYLRSTLEKLIAKLN